MSNPQADAAKALQSQLQRQQYDTRYNTTPMSYDAMNAIMTRGLIGDRNRALSQAGSLNTARGYSQGYGNPFSLARRAEAQTYDQYAGALGGVMGGNIDRSFNQRFQSNQANWGRLASILGMQQGNIGNLSRGWWNETVGPLLGSAIGAGGQIVGAGLGSNWGKGFDSGQA